jgi:hypothetical protein
MVVVVVVVFLAASCCFKLDGVPEKSCGSERTRNVYKWLALSFVIRRTGIYILTQRLATLTMILWFSSVKCQKSNIN